MKRIFSSNPYVWFLLTIVMVSILIIGMLNIFTNGKLSIALTTIAFIMAYLIVPKYMNFKLILEIRKDSIYFQNDKKQIQKDKIKSIQLKENETIEITYLTKDELAIKRINKNQVHITIDRLYNILKSI